MAAITAAVVGTAATVGSAVNQRNAAKRAAGQQERAADQAIELQRETRDMARQDLMPYSEMGQRAIPRLEQLAGGTPNNGYRRSSRPVKTPLGMDLTGLDRPVNDRPSRAPVQRDNNFRQGVTLDPNYQSNVQDFNRTGDFQGKIQNLDANAEYIPAQRQQRQLNTDFNASPRPTYEDAASRTDQRFRDAAETVADQVSARAAARGKLDSGETLNELFRQNLMLGEGLTQSAFDRNRRLEDRDRINTAQDESIYSNNLSRNLAANASDRQDTALDAQIFDQNFNRDVTGNQVDQNNQLALAKLYGDNFNRALTTAGFNRDNEQARERTANNNFARNLDLAALNRQEAGMRDGLLNSDYNRNLSLVQLGQNSAAGQAGSAQNAGNAISNLYTQRGNATAAGTIGRANATSNFLDQLTRLAGSAA